MNKDISKIVKKTAKIAGVTCVAAGAIAIVTSKAALQAIVKGGEYLADTVKKIMDEEEIEAEVVAEAAPAEEPQDEVAAAEEDFVAEEAETEENV